MTARAQTLLIVDDEMLNISILANVLSGSYRILVAKSGEQALGLLNTDKVDLVLLDIVMPEMDGYEVCKRLKSDDQTRNIPVIFISARGEDEDEERGLKTGAVDYIRKPFYLPIVAARVKTHLDLKLKTDMLEQMAAIDGLTNIANRRKFDETLEAEWKRTTHEHLPLSLIISDVDYFKQYNDHYGHAAGDDCLRQVARRLEAALPGPGNVLARFGGEEFAAILPETDHADATNIAAKLVQSIANPAILHAHSPVAPYVTISAGLATALPGRACETPRQLIEAADAMLYAAKRHGRNQWQSKEVVC